MAVSDRSFLYDEKGKAYLDLQMWYSAVNLGYRNRAVVEAVQKQMDTLPQLASSYIHEGKIVLSRQLAERNQEAFGEEGRVHFNVGGSQAIEDSMKLLRKKTGKTKFLAFQGSYHGRTIAATEIDLVNYYAIADAAVVTPLRDGMNLVAKEFLLAQHAENPGVLILSEFCGAASELSDALIVNPVNRKQVSEAYLTALEMSSDEVQRRYKAMLSALEVYSAKNWGERFIESLRMASERSSNLSPEFSAQLQRQARQHYAKAKQRLILLD